MVEVEGVKAEPEEFTDKELLTKERSFMFEERLEVAGKLRQLGNERFKRGRMKSAAEAYQRALHHVDFDELQVNFELSEKHRTELKEAKLPILLNLCQSLVRTSDSNGDGSHVAQAKERASEAIELDPECAKAWFWRGKAKMDSGDLEGSGKDLEQAAKLAPGDKAVRLGIRGLQLKKKELAVARRNLWGGMFRGGTGGTPAPGRRQLEEAAARARGDSKASRGGKSNRDGGGGGWRLPIIAVFGAVFFAGAGVLAARYANSTRLS